MDIFPSPSSVLWYICFIYCFRLCHITSILEQRVDSVFFVKSKMEAYIVEYSMFYAFIDIELLKTHLVGKFCSLSMVVCQC